MSTGNPHSTPNVIDSPTDRVPSPFKRPEPGRHRLAGDTQLKWQAAHIARHILDDPEAYQRRARRARSYVPVPQRGEKLGQLGGVA